MLWCCNDLRIRPCVLERAVGLGDPPGSSWRAVPCWWATPCEGSAVDDAGLSRCIKVLKMNHCFSTTCQVYAACVFCALWSHRGNSVLALGDLTRRHAQASLPCHRSYLALGNDKGLKPKEYTTIVIVYVPIYNSRVSKYVRQKPIWLQGDIDKLTIIVEELKNPLWEMKKSNKPGKSI